MTSHTAGKSEAPPSWRLSDRLTLDFSKTRLLAVINVTPDSFSDGGEHLDPAAAVAFAHQCVALGADGLDIGGESSRPGAERIAAAEQIRRVVPVIEQLRSSGLTLPITVDTTLADVAAAAITAGADAINDVSAGLEDPQLLPLAAARGVGIILMHRVRPPDEDVYSHQYQQELIRGDVVAAVVRDLRDRVQAAIEAGVRRESIVLDPGLGFGKTVEQNLRLVMLVQRLVVLGHPVLFGASRKSFLGHVTGEQDPACRGPESVAAAVLMHTQGARFFRVHDIGMHRKALAVADAVATTCSP